VIFLNSTLRTLNGSLTIDDGSTLNLSPNAGGDLALGLHFYQYGTFNCNERTVKFIGGNEKYIYAKVGESITFDYLDVGVSFLDLFQGDVIIDNELIFSSGKVWLVYGNLVLNANATVTGASDGNVVFNQQYDGGLKLKGVTSAGKTFPIGDYNGNYSPITIKPTNTTDFLIKLKTNFTNNPLPLVPSNTVSLEWQIEPSTAPGVTTLIFKPHPSKLNMTNTPGTAVVGHFTGGSWVEHPATYDAGAGTWTYIHSGSFSPFGVGVAGSFTAVLKAELLNFKAIPKAEQVQLTWQTASETNLKNFAIEKSTDSKIFEKIAEVKANNTPSVYQATDDTPFGGKGAYYRLKINDLDGTSNYSKIVFVEKNTALGGKDAIKISHHTEGPVLIETNDQIEQVTLKNTVGQVLKTGKTAQLSLHDLPTGIFIVSVKTNKNFVSQKIFKE
jgi:hypothetical protein